MCLKAFILFICIWFIDYGLCGRCPSTWLEMPNGTSCYKLWPNAKKTWDDARDTCQLLNSDLLKLNSKEEKDWIIGEIKKFSPNLEWWIGLKRHGADETKWVWIDGETRNDSNKFIMWGSGEPNNHLKSEDCAEIWDSLLNDKNCITPLQFICEQPSDTPRPCDMDNGWEDIYPGKNCYKVLDLNMTADNAELTCSRNNASLLQITDDKEQYIFSDFITESNFSVWLDLKAMQELDGSYEWRWTRTGQIDVDQKYWLMDQYENDWDSVSSKNLFCVKLRPSLSANKLYKTWEPAICEEQNRVICEKVPITCPVTFYKFTLFKCLKPMVSDSLLTWNEARGYCNLRGTTLLEIHSQYELNELNRVMENILTDASLRSSKFWLGLKVNGIEQTWDSGRAAGDLVSKLLESGGATNETIGCAYLQLDGFLQWKVGSCEEYSVAMCMVPGNTAIITPTHLKPMYVCPDHYEVIENTCIRQHYGDPVDWFGARYLCGQDGASLASIQTTEKLDFLKDRTKGSFWIGLNDLQSEGSLVWSDEKTKYGGEMNNTLDSNNFSFDKYSENCFALTEDGKLIDQPCNFQKSFFCQIWAEWNIALGKIARQSSDYTDRKYNIYTADMAIDGCTKSTFSEGCCTHTKSDSTPWWELDLGTIYPIRKVIIHRRFEAGCAACKGRMHNFRLFISNTSDTSVNPMFQDVRMKPPMKIIINLPEINYGRYVRIDVPNSNKPLTLCEVQIFSEDLNRPETQRVLMEKTSNCFIDAKKWNGKINHGISGRLCQEWVLDTPHKHTRHNDNAFSDGSQRAAKNYCRDPDGKGRPWCYTVDPNVRWEYCPIPHCNTIIKDKQQGQMGGEDLMQITQEEIVSDCGGPGWTEDSTGVCYTFHGAYTAEDGQSYCKAWGGDLVVPGSIDEVNSLAGMYNLTIDSVVWLGVSYSTDSLSWKTVDNSKLNETFVSSMINKNDILKNVSNGTACIVVDFSGQQNQYKWRTDGCLNRHHFLCQKNSKNFLYNTPNSKEVLVTNDPAFKLSEKSSVIFEFKGESGARIILKNTAVNSQLPVVINIGSDGNTQSTLMIKFRSVNGFSAPISKSRYHRFWISWSEGNIQVGEGDFVGDRVFLEGRLPGFVGFDYMSVSVSGTDEGYWKFPREGCKASGERNLALKKKTWQSSTYADISSSDKAVDGCSKNRYDSECCIRTSSENRPWWEVDLGAVYNIREIVMTKRWDCETCRPRMNKFYVHINNTKISASKINDDTISYSRNDRFPLPVVTLKTPGARGRFVLIELPGSGELEFCEIEIYEDTGAKHCKPGWLSYDSQTCMYIGTAKADWSTARSQCKTKDPESDLAVFTSSKQEMFIFENAAKVLPQSEPYRFWFGLKDVVQKDVTWWDATTSNYSRLMNGEGLKNLGSQKCFITSYDDSDYTGWVQLQCSTPMFYICSKTKVEVPTTTVMTTIPTTKTIVTTTTLTNATTISTQPMTTGQGTTRNVATTTVALEGSCPEDWIFNPSTLSCLYINQTRKMDFLAAELSCLKKQSRLASIASEEEERFFFGFLFDHVKEVGAYKGNYDGFWLGGLDIEKEGSWKWFLYDEPWFDVKWSPGQPDNYGGGEDCLMVRAHLAHLNEMNDAGCTKQHLEGFICKKYVNDGFCEEGWYYDARTDFCYLVQEDLKTWSQAEAVCVGNYGADLASIVSNKEQEFIGVILSSNRQKPSMYWVGAKTDPQDDTWWWSDRSTWWMRIAWNGAIYQLEKLFYGKPVDCGRLLCTLHPTEIRSQKVLNQQSYDIWRTQRLTKIDCPRGEHYEKNRKCIIPEIWKKETADVGKQCGAVLGTKRLTDEALLTNHGCDEILPFVCKKQAQRSQIGATNPVPRTRKPVTTIVTTTTAVNLTTSQPTTVYVNKECGEGWEKRPNSRYCYKFGVDVQTWSQATDICTAAGGKLLSITSDEEQHYIAGRLNGMEELPLQMWIGANDKQVEGKWTWSDGSPFVYFNWKPMEPNDFNDKEDCASIITAKAISFGENFGLWNDIGCDSTQGYICKKKALDLSTTIKPQTTTKPVIGNVTYGCPNKGWLEYGDDLCYLFVQEATSWKVASTECGLEGGDLASINNELEQEFIFSQLPQDIYCFNIWNNNTECSVWAQRGECTRNPIWMATQCHEACNLCKHNCRDRYENSEKCLLWASQGECDLNPIWMRENCAAACGVCRGAPTRGFWIGLYSSKGSHQYEWSDDSPVTYTNWDYTVKQPRYYSYAGGSCGAMFIQTGTWNDGPCSETLQGYVCKTRKQPMSTTPASPFKTGCSADNSFGYEEFCYTYVSEQKTFIDAQQYCVENGGHLAYVKNRYVQSFIWSELINKLQDYWIGIKFEEKMLKWADNSEATTLKFINFVKTFDLLRGNDSCFAMTSYRPFGLWKDHNCTEKLPFLCQSLREGYTTTASTTVTTTEDIPCKSGWIPFQGYCYYFPDEVSTWFEANIKCAALFSYMITIGKREENQFISQNLLEVTWLGLTDMEVEGRFTWVDGKPLIYINWNDEEPNNVGNEDCASIIWSGKWNDLPCDRARHYACKVPKGKQLTTTTTSTISTTATTAKLCDDNWVFYGGYCYHFFGRANWHEAKQYCLDVHSHLVSIHSSQEQGYVNEMISEADDVVWSGFNDLDVDGVFKWTDGTATDYSNWYPGQPNDGGGGEKCVAVSSNHDGQWHDYPCRDNKYGLCKRPQGAPVTGSTAPPTPRPGGCPSEFKEFGNKCYLVVGKDGQTLKTWEEANQFCISKKASLTSIHSATENAFITSLMFDASTKGFWIGFNDLMRKNGQFDWSDNSQVDFTSWAENEPSSNAYYYYERELCVEMFAKDDVGNWNDAQCVSSKGYICSMYKNVDYPSRVPDECRDGYQFYNGHCYKGLSAPSSWDSCQAQCVQDDSYLVSLGSVYEKAFIESLTYGPIWVGMKLHRYGEDQWVNGEPQTLSDLQTILANNSVGCLRLEPETGTWIVQSCHNSLFGICEYSTVSTTMRTTPYEEKICSNRDLFLYDGTCYFVSTTAASFEQANTMCQQKNMTFVSIHSYRENNELINMVNETALKSRAGVRQFFIGMYFEPERDKIPKWIDKSPVSYLRITPEFYQIGRTIFTICFAFDTTKKENDWTMIPCDRPTGYICKMKADAPQTTVTTTTSTTTTTTPTTTTTTPTTTTTTTMTTSSTTESTTTTLPNKPRPRVKTIRVLRKDDSLSPGQLAAIIVGSIAFILVLIVVGYVIRSGYMRRYLYRVQNTSSLGFDNALFHKGEEGQRESVNFD